MEKNKGEYVIKRRWSSRRRCLRLLL